MFYSYIDSFANPIFGANLVVSGGYGANVSGTTGTNGYYALSIKPVNIGGPFALSFAVTSSYGNYNTIQGNLTVTAPIVVPVQDVLAGVTIAGQTGTMVNHGGYTNASGNWANGSGTLYSWIPYGAYLQDSGSGSGTPGINNYDPNFIASNIVSGKSIYGLSGTAQTLNIVAGDAVASEIYSTENTYTQYVWTQYTPGFKINVPGTYRIKLQLLGPSGSAVSANAQVRVNGAPVGTTFSYYNYTTYGGSWQDCQEDITVNAGDYVTLWYQSVGNFYSPYADVGHLRLCYGVAGASGFATQQ